MIQYDEYAIINPYNILDNCLRISSTVKGESYRLNNLPIIKGKYTFSVWCKSDSNTTISFNILGTITSTEVTTEWGKITYTVNTDCSCKYIDFIPTNTNIYIYLYEGQLEEGTVNTSWHSAEEDNDVTKLEDTILNWAYGALGKNTYINGGLIATNTITAEKIALGDFINYASWKEKTESTCPFTTRGSAWTVDNSVYHSYTASYKYTSQGTSLSSAMGGIRIPVSVGEKIYVEFYYKTDPGWICTTGNSKLRFGKSDGSHIKSYAISGTQQTEWTKVSGTYSVTSSTGPYIIVSIIMSGSTEGKSIWIDDIIIKKMTTGELIVDGAITADKISVDTLEAICAKIGGFNIGSKAIYNGTSSLTSTTAGIYLGTDGIRNYKDANTYVDIKNGVLTAKAANVSGTITTSNITATGGKIGGWNLNSSKIYSGDSSSGVVVMRSPTASTSYVFAAGGTSHSDYSDCPFRVTAGGKVYASRLYVSGDPNIDSGEGFYIYDPMNKKYLLFADCDGGIRFPAFDYHFTGNLRIDKIDSDLIPTEADVYDIGSGSKYYSMLYAKGVRIGSSPYDASDGWISTLWKDGNSHQIVARSTDGLTASFGWYGTNEYKTVTQLRGQTVRYVNSSGTTTLSDERMKKDFKDLNAWEEFYSNAEPCAFKYIDGVSGRYHVGFKAQQIQDALESSGLTTQDFAGFIQYNVDPLSDDWHGYETEYGLIYTEFIALNTHMIQKLMNRVNELEEKLKEVVSMYGI